MNTISPAVIHLRENRPIPNNPSLPVLIYRDIFADRIADKYNKFHHVFEINGWKGIWRNGLYDYHHFHSSSHEVLGIANGRAEIQLGGEGALTVELAAGDAIVLPAGTGHRRLSASDNLVVVGAYPAGQENYDICRRHEDYSGNILSAIASTLLPQSDPLYGLKGPLLQLWHS